MNCMPWTRLRIVFAFGGILMPSASSTARQLAIACTVVHTPQMRCVKAHASRGSRPCMMISRPRNCVAEAHALEIFPFSDCASMRRWPSIRVIGSTTTLVLAIALLLLWTGFRNLLGLLAALDLVQDGHRRVGHDAGGGAHRERGADRVHLALDAKAGDIRQAAVERGHGGHDRR